MLYEVREGDAGQQQCTKLLQKAREQKLAALEITPSYGASFIILAGSYELLNREKWSEKYGPRLAASTLEVFS